MYREGIRLTVPRCDWRSCGPRIHPRTKNRPLRRRPHPVLSGGRCGENVVGGGVAAEFLPSLMSHGVLEVVVPEGFSPSV